MKLIALHDAEGRILAAYRHSAEYTGPVPVASEGTTLAQVEIPEAHHGLALDAICRGFRIHPETKLLTRRDEAAGDAGRRDFFS